MRYAIIFIFLLLSNTQTFCYNSPDKEYIQIIISDNNKILESKIREYVENNKKSLIYDIKVETLPDNSYNNDYSGSLEFIDNKLLSPPKIILYFNNNNSYPEGIYGFNKKLQPNIKVIQYILQILDLEESIAKKFILNVSGIDSHPPVIDIYTENNLPIIIIQGNINLEKVLTILTIPLETSKSENFYFILHIFKHTIYLNENQIILRYIVLIAIISLFFSIKRRYIKFHLKHNKKYLISIIFKLLAVFIFYFIATLVIEFIIDNSSKNLIIYKYSRSLFLIKNMILMFIYGISFHIIKDTSFSKSPHFYGLISLLLSVASAIYLSTIYLPLGFYQIWPIVVTMLFILIPDKSIKSLLLLLAPIVTILLIMQNLSYSNNFINLFINNRHQGNILLTVIAAPYLFLQDSYNRFANRRHNKLIYKKDIITSIILLTAIITYILIIREIIQNNI